MGKDARCGRDPGRAFLLKRVRSRSGGLEVWRDG